MHIPPGEDVHSLVNFTSKIGKGKELESCFKERKEENNEQSPPPLISML